jgi:hypothetical protein
LAGCWSTGCQNPNPQAKTESSISTDLVLDRCVDAFKRLKTLQTRGTLRDDRADSRRISPISWDLARPGKCRLQIGGDLALVIGDNWWTYDAAGGQFRKHKAFTRTPMETAASLVSRGVSFLIPALFTRGEAAFGKSRMRGYAEWRLLGVAWLANRPCYVLARQGRAAEGGALLRVWIDQDSYLLRGWDIVRQTTDGREVTILECAYQELVVDEAIPAERFALTAPSSVSGKGPHLNE